MKKLLAACALFFLSTGLASADTKNISGLELGTTDECASTNGTFNLNTSTVRTGSYSLQVNPVGTAQGYCQIESHTPSGGASSLNAATIYTRFYFRYATKPASNYERIIQVRATSTVKMGITLDSNGNLGILDSASTLIATGTTALAANTWYRIETISQASTSAAYEVRLDGATELSGTGFNFGAPNNDDVRFGKATNINGNTVSFFYDDINISDSAFPGAGEGKLMLPNGAGAYQTFTTSTAGNHWELVDEVPANGDTDYLISPGGSGVETEALQDTATVGITGTVNAVKENVYMKRDGAGNSSVQIRLRSGTTDDDGGTITAGLNYGDQHRLFGTDPATGSAWVLSALDSIEAGIEDVDAASDKARLSMVNVYVDYTPSAAPASSSRTRRFFPGASRARY